MPVVSIDIFNVPLFRLFALYVLMRRICFIRTHLYYIRTFWFCQYTRRVDFLKFLLKNKGYDQKYDPENERNRIFFDV